MLNQMIGKNVEITVALGASLSSGSVPMAYYGILRAVDEEYCMLSLGYKQPVYYAVMKMANLGENCSGNILIRKDYVISCRELD